MHDQLAIGDWSLNLSISKLDLVQGALSFSQASIDAHYAHEIFRCEVAASIALIKSDKTIDVHALLPTTTSMGKSLTFESICDV